MRAIGLALVLAGLVTAGGLNAQQVLLGDPFDARIIEAQTLVAGSGSYLGVGVADINAERVKALKLKEERGVEVTRVEDNSPASKAGLKVGDVVLDYNGQRVEGTAQFQRMVRETPADRQVRLLISRDGATQTVTAAVGQRKAIGLQADVQAQVEQLQRAYEARKQDLSQLRLQIPDTPRALMSWNSGALGVEAEAVSDQLAGYFGVKEGVLVRSVAKSSAAEKAGIKAGDVITKVGDTKVTTPSEVTKAIRDLGDKKTFPVTVVRDRKETSLSVTLEATKTVTPLRTPIVGRDTQL
jgi:serine protease Do